MRIVIEEKILKKNDDAARENRAAFDAQGIVAVNFMSAPGAGKTTLLEKTLPLLRDRFRLAVIEGDPCTSMDAERIRATGIRAHQINTGGGCHLDARMIRAAMQEFPVHDTDLVLIENVGNMMCPAEFNLGEQFRVMIYSCVEGAEKPKKYPVMFRTCHAVIINKIDLLPYAGVSLDELCANVLDVNPTAVILPVSCRTGEGLAAWVDWFQSAVETCRERLAPCV
jgi:hydrogenase nickel incorporation protein HypB